MSPSHQNCDDDEETLADDEIVIRKIPSINILPTDDGRRAVHKGAFSESSSDVDPEKGVSVDSLNILEANGIDPIDPHQFAPNSEVLMGLRVRELHDEGMKVVLRPTTDNPAHCNVLGVNKNKRRKLLNLAEFIRRPNNVIKHGDV